MGKVTGFLDFERIENKSIAPKTRVKNFKEFVIPFSSNVLNQQASRCMNCGIPYCHSSCPVNNIIPEWNELVYEGDWREALDTLHSTNNFPEFTGRICPAPCEAACTLNIEDSPVTSKQLGELVDNIENGKISNRQAKEVLEEMCESGKGALEIIDEKGLSQISDENEIESLVDNVLNSNPENVKKYKNGKDKLFGFFVGEAMKLSKGKANPKIVNDLIKKKLSQ